MTCICSIFHLVCEMSAFCFMQNKHAPLTTSTYEHLCRDLDYALFYTDIRIRRTSSHIPIPIPFRCVASRLCLFWSRTMLHVGARASGKVEAGLISRWTITQSTLHSRHKGRENIDSRNLFTLRSKDKDDISSRALSFFASRDKQATHKKEIAPMQTGSQFFSSGDQRVFPHKRKMARHFSLFNRPRSSSNNAVVIVGSGQVGCFLAKQTRENDPTRQVILKTSERGASPLAQALCKSLGVEVVSSFPHNLNADVVFVTTKIFSHEDACAELAEALNEANKEPVVALVHNGYAPVPTILENRAVVLPCVALGGYKVKEMEDGYVDVQVTNKDAPWMVAPREGCERVVDLLHKSGIKAESDSTFEFKKLRKYLVNGTANLLSIVHNVNCEQLVENHLSHMEQIFDEIFTVLSTDPDLQEAWQYAPPRAELRDLTMACISSYGCHYPSTKQDFDSGRPLEMLNDFVLYSAEKRGLQAPVNTSLSQSVRALVSARDLEIGLTRIDPRIQQRFGSRRSTMSRMSLKAGLNQIWASSSQGWLELHTYCASSTVRRQRFGKSCIAVQCEQRSGSVTAVEHCRTQAQLRPASVTQSIGGLSLALLCEATPGPPSVAALSGIPIGTTSAPAPTSTGSSGSLPTGRPSAPTSTSSSSLLPAGSSSTSSSAPASAVLTQLTPILPLGQTPTGSPTLRQTVPPFMPSLQIWPSWRLPSEWSQEPLLFGGMTQLSLRNLRKASFVLGWGIPLLLASCFLCQMRRHRKHPLWIRRKAICHRVGFVASLCSCYFGMIFIQSSPAAMLVLRTLCNFAVNAITYTWAYLGFEHVKMLYRIQSSVVSGRGQRLTKFAILLNVLASIGVGLALAAELLSLFLDNDWPRGLIYFPYMTIYSLLIFALIWYGKVRVLEQLGDLEKEVLCDMDVSRADLFSRVRRELRVTLVFVSVYFVFSLFCYLQITIGTIGDVNRTTYRKDYVAQYTNELRFKYWLIWVVILLGICSIVWQGWIQPEGKAQPFMAEEEGKKKRQSIKLTVKPPRKSSKANDNDNNDSANNANNKNKDVLVLPADLILALEPYSQNQATEGPRIEDDDLEKRNEEELEMEKLSQGSKKKTLVGSKQSKHRSREDSYTLNSDMDQQLSHPEALEKPHVVEVKPEEKKKTTLKKIRNFLLQSELEIKIGPPLPPKLHLDPAARKFFNGSASSVDLASHSESSSLSTAQVARRDRVQWGMSYSGSDIEFARVDSDGGRSNRDHAIFLALNTFLRKKKAWLANGLMPPRKQTRSKGWRPHSKGKQKKATSATCKRHSRREKEVEKQPRGQK
eukprot:g40829.t1